MRHSKQRDAIVQELREAGLHLNADELHGRLRKTLPGLSLATVYRNLNHLADSGLIRRIRIEGSSKVYYDIRNDEHCHLVCRRCGSIQDIDMDYFIQADRLIRDSLGFSVECHHISLQGLCAACRTAGLEGRFEA